MRNIKHLATCWTCKGKFELPRTALWAPGDTAIRCPHCSEKFEKPLLVEPQSARRGGVALAVGGAVLLLIAAAVLLVPLLARITNTLSGR
jgi:DNA-directed RNA polymerase subunit RPC12/RpoP